MDRVFALLDDRDATAGHPTSRLYTGFVREHVCADPARLDAVWAEVEADLRRGLHAVLLADYEWGAKLLKAGHCGLKPGDGAALRLLMFEHLGQLSREMASAWLTDREEREALAAGVAQEPQPAGVMRMQPSVDKAAFTAAIDRIQHAIADGETYQVNYTYRLTGQAYGSPAALYRRLRERQPVAFGALMGLPVEPGDADGVAHVLSCSPELFLRHEAGVLTARPMKGTASRFDPPEGDSETARHLSLDIKNRAENLMIVDLLRNDLGRVAQTGSVTVPELFSVEPYNTLFQMTSTVQARLKPECSFPDLLRAVFPCGSITGAPKHHTMELIEQLETTPRGIYCGAIGWVEASAAAKVGNFCLSVAIRTLTLGPEHSGLRCARLGLGAGIVQDSVAGAEFEECQLKGRFLTALDPGFRLFETMLAAPDGGAAPVLRHLNRHMGRLGDSAHCLGFEFDRDAVLRALNACVAGLPQGLESRVRLSLGHNGRLEVSAALLPALPGDTVSLLIAGQCLPDARPLAAHKTTLRAHYDEGVCMAQRAGAFDSLFFTRDGRLVEGGRSSVFLKLDNRWWTPPVAQGALRGVMRGLVLEDPAWRAAERTLRIEDLRRAQAVMVCNALRGTLPARLMMEAAPA
jgi:para-aminobenzoate synthetase / 4-amino-4-deoxychorismate lyase